MLSNNRERVRSGTSDHPCTSSDRSARMFNGIRAIKNPLARSLTAAGITFTSVVMISGAVIGFSKSEDDSVYKLGGYAALIRAGLGAVFGLVGGSAADESSPASRSDVAIAIRLRHWCKRHLSDLSRLMFWSTTPESASQGRPSTRP
jgi:hypothetical protein